MAGPQIFQALDLEMNSTGTIIQVGTCVGYLDDSFHIENQEGWIIRTDEEIDPKITELTGIKTEDVRGPHSVPLEVAYRGMCKTHQNTGAFINLVTWGGPDGEILRAQLPANLEWRFGRRWIDVKTIYTYECLIRGKHPAGGLSKSMGRMGLKFVGTEHNAVHDAFNTMSFLLEMVKRRVLAHKCLTQAQSFG